MSTMQPMTFAESYVLASKVRSKLTKEASNPKTSLRSLVLQANMLDNLMDHITLETEKRRSAPSVSFSVPKKTHTAGTGPSVTEYEVDSDSDDDSDDAAFRDSDYSDDELFMEDSSDEDDYYYSSDEEEVALSVALAPVKSFKKLPVIDLSAGQHLLVIYEEQEDMPELTRSTSNSDSDSDEEDDVPRFFTNANAHKISSEELLRGHVKEHHHLRHNAIYLMEDVF